MKQIIEVVLGGLYYWVLFLVGLAAAFRCVGGYGGGCDTLSNNLYDALNSLSESIFPWYFLIGALVIAFVANKVNKKWGVIVLAGILTLLTLLIIVST